MAVLHYIVKREAEDDKRLQRQETQRIESHHSRLLYTQCLLASTTTLQLAS